MWRLTWRLLQSVAAGQQRWEISVSDAFEWIQWGVRQGGNSRPAPDRATASHQARVLTALGHPAEVVHCHVTEEDRTGSVSQNFGDWRSGEPDGGTKTVYRASATGNEDQIFTTVSQAWQHLIAADADSTADPGDFTLTGTVRAPDHHSYTVTAFDIPITS